jgi:hypothetical protein
MSQGKAVWRRWWFWVPLVLVMLVIAGIAGATLDESAAPSQSPVVVTTSPATLTPSVVPEPGIKLIDVIGLPVDKAESRLNADAREANLSLNIVIERKYSHEHAGTVFQMFPSPGTLVHLGDEISLLVAKVIPRVPNVINEKVSSASHTLEQLGYSVKSRGKVSDQPKDTVLSQSVPPGKRAIPGETTIILTVAKPPPGWYVAVFGSGSAMVTWGDIGSTSQETVALPWSTKVSAGGAFNVVTVLAQRQSGSSGSITCEIIHNGRIVKKATSSGPYAICTATHST